MVFATTLGVAPAAHAGTLNAWMTPGFTLNFVASPGATTNVDPSAPTVSSTFPVTIVVAAVAGSSISFDYVQAGAVQLSVEQVTYDLASRMGPEGGSILWINPSDIAAGQADFAGRTAVLLVDTPAVVEFSDGQRDYYFDPNTGLLLRGEDLFTGSALVASGTALGVVPSTTPDTSPTITVTSTLHPLFWGGDLHTSTSHFETSCGGSIDESEFGGFQHCPMDSFFEHTPFHAYIVAQFPKLGQGTIALPIQNEQPDLAEFTCTSTKPALTADDVYCTATSNGYAFTQPEFFPRASASFSYCLDPLTLFSCEWSAQLIADGFS
jgi:hypothetical protein